MKIHHLELNLLSSSFNLRIITQKIRKKIFLKTNKIENFDNSITEIDEDV